MQTVRIEMDGIVDSEPMRLSKVSLSRRLKRIAPTVGTGRKGGIRPAPLTQLRGPAS